MPRDDGPVPIPGISVRSINGAQIEIANTAARVYYFAVTAWVVEDDLACGRGLVAREFSLGPVAAGQTIVVGVTQDVPITVEAWDRPCGEGCTREPIGASLVAMSSFEPPGPQET